MATEDSLRGRPILRSMRGALATFLPSGALLVSPAVTYAARVQLGMAPDLRVRWLDDRHLPYLTFHRSQCGWLNE